MRRILAFSTLWMLLASCTPLPIRPASQTDIQRQELDQCDFAYSRCQGQPGKLGTNEHMQYWQGEPVANCNNQLKSCYEKVRKK